MAFEQKFKELQCEMHGNYAKNMQNSSIPFPMVFYVFGVNDVYGRVKVIFTIIIMIFKSGKLCI